MSAGFGAIEFYQGIECTHDLQIPQVALFLVYTHNGKFDILQHIEVFVFKWHWFLISRSGFNVKWFRFFPLLG